MSDCQFTNLIDSNSYIGDSLVTINGNLSSLDTNLCVINASLSALSTVVNQFGMTVGGIANSITSLVYATNISMVTTLNVLVSTILAGSTGFTSGTLILPSTYIANSASVVFLSGYPVGCDSISQDNSILFTVNGIAITNQLLAINNIGSYTYSWFYGGVCNSQYYKIFLIGYI